MSGLSPQMINFAIVLAMIPVGKRINFSDPTVLMICRAAYVASNLIIGAVYMYIQMLIKRKKDMTVLKYVEPSPLGSTEDPKLVTTTIHEYDSTQVRNAVRSQMMGIAMMLVMHVYMGYTNPLVVQSILPLKGALESNMAKIHVWGNPATGDLKRPFKAPGGMLAGMMGGQGGGVQSDKKAIESAERAGRGGAKEE